MWLLPWKAVKINKPMFGKPHKKALIFFRAFFNSVATW